MTTLKKTFILFKKKKEANYNSIINIDMARELKQWHNFLVRFYQYETNHYTCFQKVTVYVIN